MLYLDPSAMSKVLRYNNTTSMDKLTLEHYQNYYSSNVNYYQKYIHKRFFGRVRYLYLLSMNTGYFQAITSNTAIDEYFIHCDRLADRLINRYEYNCIKTYCSVVSSI